MKQFQVPLSNVQNLKCVYFSFRYFFMEIYKIEVCAEYYCDLMTSQLVDGMNILQFVNIEL